MDWPWWCIIFLSLSMLTRGSKCPEGPDCSNCSRYPEDIYEMECVTSNDTMITVQMQMNEYVQFDCHESSKWTGVNLDSSELIRGAKKLLFKNCDLPEGNGFASIAKQLQIENLQGLHFSSYNDLSYRLSSETLKGLGSVKALTFSNNNFTTLPDDLLKDMTNLTVLLLRKNNLHTLPKNFFSPPKLKFLELSVNELVTLDENSFGRLENLKILNIHFNHIANIEPNTFDGLETLQSLDLRNNNLETLPAQIFSQLRNIETIDLSYNNFSENSLSPELLKNCYNLSSFLLVDNKRNLTTLPEQFFANLTNLTSVNLRRIGLTTIPENLFAGATNLQSVSLDFNYLSDLPTNIFRDNRQLLHIDLSGNKISSLPDGIFSNLRQINSLDLSRNRITTISANLFTGLTTLHELNMARNNISNIHFEAFMSLQKLKKAKFSYNSLDLKSLWGKLGSPFRSCMALEELYLNHNNVSDIFDDWMFIMNQLRILDLSYNNFQNLTGSDLQFLSLNLEVDLTSNQIRHINLNDVEQWASTRTYQRNVIVSLANNPIECDCELYDLLRYLEGKMSPNVQNAFRLDVEKLRCSSPGHILGKPITDFKSNTLVCDTKATKNDDDCPCKCGFRPYDGAYLVDCANAGLTQSPRRVNTLLKHSFIHLNLSGNSLTDVPNLKERDYGKVTHLVLDNNNISSISVDSLSSDLQVLNLHKNSLTRLDQSVIDYFNDAPKLKELTLHSNPWSCDCEARPFLNFVQKNSLKLPDLMNVTCRDRESEPLYQMTPEEFCSTDIMWITIGCSLLALFGMIFGALAALYYRYQREIKVWLYANNLCLWFVTENELDKDKIFDAFISYSHKDEDFVVNELMPNLEAEPRPFKLCVHFRDWLAGEWIPTQISRSVEESRRTIVVLSPNFLESVWGRMEFRAAHSQALSEGRARVIVILYGDIGPTENLDPELKAYLSMNTYVKWGDPWFWKKLEYAMPHPAGFNKRKNCKSIFETTQPPRIAITNDKAELIKPPGVPSTPPVSTTPPADSVKIFIVDGLANNQSNKQPSSNIDHDPPRKIVINPHPKNNVSLINKIQCTTV